MLLSPRLARVRITAVTAGLLAATVRASPFIESFTLSEELLASLPAVLSLLCFCRYLDGRERAGSSNRLLLSLVGAGALTGIAVLIKQSAFDAGLAALVYLLWQERRRGLAPAALLVASALVPIAIAAAAAGGRRRPHALAVGTATRNRDRGGSCGGDTRTGDPGRLGDPHGAGPDDLAGRSAPGPRRRPRALRACAHAPA